MIVPTIKLSESTIQLFYIVAKYKNQGKNANNFFCNKEIT